MNDYTGSEFYIDEFDDLDDSKYLAKDDLGWLHFLIEDVEDPQDNERELVQAADGSGDEYHKAEAVKLTLSVQAPAELVGKQTELYLTRTGGFAKRTGKFARMFGLITQEMIDEAREAGRNSIRIPWAALTGKHFCAERERDEYTNKKGEKKVTGKIKWNFMLPEEAAEKGHPVNMEAAKDPFAQDREGDAQADATAAADDAAFVV